MISFVGIGVGLMLAIAAARLLHGAIFGIPAEEPLSLAAAAIILLTVTMTAVYVPARRGARINPINALRHE